MSDEEQSRQLVLRYFNSWQQPANFDEMRSYLADNLIFDAGFHHLEGGDAFAEFCKNAGSPWEDVDLLATIFKDNEATLFYEGVNVETRVKTRVAEHITVKQGKIAKIITVMLQL